MSVPAPPDGFVEFVATRSPVLLRSAWLLTGDAGKAEDLLQTVLALVWPRWRRLVAGGNPEAYIRRVLFTTYLSWRRRRWRYEVPTSTMPDRGNLVAGRVRRHRQRFAIAAATAVVAVLTVGTTAFQLFLPAPHHGPVVPPGGTASTSVSPSTAPEDRLGPAITASPAQPPGV